MSMGVATDLGVPEYRWVFLHCHADLREPSLMDRPQLSRAPSAVAAIDEAFRSAAVDVDDIATFDLYSCFPIAVTNVCDGIGLSTDDPRGLTLTGGLPYFGGAGNNYSMHAIAETVHAMRNRPGAYGLVGANGGTLSKYSVGIYSTTPRPWVPDRSAARQSELDARPVAPLSPEPRGSATIETYTVRYPNSGPLGVVVGRLDADGRRFLANPADGDEALLDLLVHGEPVGVEIIVESAEAGNRATLCTGLTAMRGSA
jgi:acetyl-CoA C-acetyltransferase